MYLSGYAIINSSAVNQIVLCVGGGGALIRGDTSVKLRNNCEYKVKVNVFRQVRMYVCYRMS